jgi:post-segregation antitoxin (ccd killing protein)
LCNITTPASPKLVREFYSNLSVTEGNVVRVRNVSVNISSAALNAYLGIPEPENDDYFNLTIQPQWEEWIRLLAYPGATYKTKTVHRQLVPSFLPISSINRFAKAWQYFICASILPNLRPHQLDHQRLALLACIVTGKGINIGRLLRERFLFCARRDTDVTLGHGRLITQLFLDAKLKIPNSEQRAPLGAPINEEKIMKLPQWKHGQAHPRGWGFIDVPERYQVGPNVSIFDEPDVEQPPPPGRAEGPPAGNQELMAMMNNFAQQLGRIDDNVLTLGNRTNVLGSFLNDFGERARERDEFHRSVYNQWTSHQHQYNAPPPDASAGVYPDVSLYPAYPQRLMEPYPFYHRWEPSQYVPPEADDDNNDDEDEDEEYDEDE